MRRGDIFTRAHRQECLCHWGRGADLGGSALTKWRMEYGWGSTPPPPDHAAKGCLHSCGWAARGGAPWGVAAGLWGGCSAPRGEVVW